MCGIWLWIRHDETSKVPQGMLNWCWETLEARGPEGTRVVDTSGAMCFFSRLAINGLSSAGMQPFEQDELVVMCNGEIYNAPALASQLGCEMKSGSDCEVLGALWKACEGNGVAFAQALDGVFALAIVNRRENTVTLARDPYGIRPLYWLCTDQGNFFASERKALEPMCDDEDFILTFPPGKVWTFSLSDRLSVKKESYHTVPWLKIPGVTGSLLSDALVQAVKKRMLSDRPVAALLSGGVDSSLIAALVQRELKAVGAGPLKTFSIGMAGATDLAYARKVAEHIGSEHHEIVVTAQEMFEAIPSVIRDIESYDITTVRASVGNWLIGREIRKQTECKVVFNGDGSDEVFGSYLYFRRAPNDWAFEAESQRLLTEIHKYDVLRSDRCISSHGLEARTPFLDKQFVSVAMGLPTADRRHDGKDQIEKDALRTAFDTGLLPREVLWRRKEAFSDGVSSLEESWYQIIQRMIRERKLVPVDWHEIAVVRGWCPLPPTEEAFYYRMLFENDYSHTGDFWPYWMPNWSPETQDPSARTLGKN